MLKIFLKKENKFSTQCKFPGKRGGSQWISWVPRYFLAKGYTNALHKPPSKEISSTQTKSFLKKETKEKLLKTRTKIAQI